MNQEFGLLDLLSVLRRRFVAIFLISIVAGAGTFGLCKFVLKPWFGHIILVKAAQLERPGPVGLKDIVTGAGKNDPEAVKMEGIGFLEFQYLKNSSRSNEANAPYLKKIENINDTNLFRLTVYGLSSVEAEKEGKIILEGLQKYFATRVKATVDNKKETFALMEQALIKARESLKNTEKAMQELGFTFVLQQRKDDLEKEIINFEKELSQLKFSIDPNQVHNFEQVEARPESPFAAFPRPKLFAVAAAFLAAFLSLLVFCLFEGEARVQASAQVANNAEFSTAGRESSWNKVPTPPQAIPLRKRA